MTTPLLTARQLCKRFGTHQAVRSIDLDILPGETLAVVGESGSGKTTLGRLLMRLYEPDSGSVMFMGEDLLKLSSSDLKQMRRHMQMIFQDPYASLNPRMTVQDIITEPLIIHGVKDDGSKARELLARVGLRPDHATRYPHEFSGGQRQRIGIARALALGPRLIVCDEPVSALDLSIRAQIINLLKELQQELALTYLFIAHNLAIVRHIADRVAVMHEGQIVELATTEELFARPQHPYTQLLLSADSSLSSVGGKAWRGTNLEN